eukprot:3048538-Pyramimonas_sp.AAC.1
MSTVDVPFRGGTLRVARNPLLPLNDDAMHHESDNADLHLPGMMDVMDDIGDEGVFDYEGGHDNYTDDSTGIMPHAHNHQTVSQMTKMHNSNNIGTGMAPQTAIPGANIFGGIGHQSPTQNFWNLAGSLDGLGSLGKTPPVNYPNFNPLGVSPTQSMFHREMLKKQQYQQQQQHQRQQQQQPQRMAVNVSAFLPGSEN